MFTFTPVANVRTPFARPGDVPRGLGAQHTAEGAIVFAPELAIGLKDIEGFSHLFVIWVFDHSDGFELYATPPTDDRPHGVFATRSPYRRRKSSAP